MLKIKNTKERNLKLICSDHYYGVRNAILQNLRRGKCKFNQVIINEIKNKLEDIITGKPHEILQCEQDLKNFIKRYRSNKKLSKKEIRKIFNYKNFVQRGIDSDWNTYKLARCLGVNTCVYCNRQYTFTIQHDNKKITRPQFDHFYSQDEHPLLALSFYNLIPCCSICNLTKSNEPFSLETHLHPYEHEYGDDAVFTWIPKNYRALIGRSNEMQIKIFERPNSFLNGSITRQHEFFRLENIFTEHSDYVQEIVLKANSYKGQYVKWLKQKFGGSLSKEELYRLALGNYRDEDKLDKRVLSKITLDIAKELNLI